MNNVVTNSSAAAQSNRLLPEDGVVTFTSADEMQAIARQQQESDVWKKCYTSELKVIDAPEQPLFKQQFITKHQLTLRDDMVDEAMNTDGYLLRFPLQKFERLPMRYTAMPCILNRAGVGGRGFSMITRSEMSFVLNTFLAHYGNSCWVLLRDEKVEAIHSGDEYDYSIMPFGDLLDAFVDGLNAEFGPQNVTFTYGFMSHEMNMATARINSKQCSDGFKQAIASLGENPDNMELLVTFTDCDVATCGANLKMSVQIHGNSLQVGPEIVLTHKNKHTVEDFKENVKCVLSSFKEAANKVNDLCNIKIKNPAGCLRSVAKKLNVAKKWVCGLTGDFTGVADQIEINGTGNCTAFEVYYYLCNIPGLMEAKGCTEKEIFQMREILARALFIDWDEHDRVFEW